MPQYEFMKENPIHVVLVVMEIHLPYSQSLKDKRMTLNRLKDKISNKLNVAIAEVGHQDSWQRSQIACTSLSTDKKQLQQLQSQIESLVIQNLDGELLYCDSEWL